MRKRKFRPETRCPLCGTPHAAGARGACGQCGQSLDPSSPYNSTPDGQPVGVLDARHRGPLHHEQPRPRRR